MNKKMRELLAKMDDAIKAAEAAATTEEKTKALDTYDALKSEYDTEERLYNAQKSAVKEPASAPTANSEKEFADAARHGFKNLNETTGSQGGYTVPVDIVTKIETLPEAAFDFGRYIDTEKVTTNTGRRTFKVRAAHTGFQNVDEANPIPEKTGPTFSVINYTIQKYAGKIPVTNELLEDSDANIVAFLTNWLREEAVATNNTAVLGKLKNLEATEAENVIDAIKKAVNVDLGIYPNVKVFTNGSGLNYLDTLKDGEGRYLLTPVVTEPGKMQLACGARAVEVVAVPDAILANDTDTGAIPFFVGDLKDFLKKFDRRQITIKQTDAITITITDEDEEDVTYSAADLDMTGFVASLRFDYEVKDSSAVVALTFTPTADDDAEG